MSAKKEALCREGKNDTGSEECCIKEQSERTENAEAQMLGFMAEAGHAKQGTECAAQKGKCEKASLRNAPRVLLGTAFVNAVERKGSKIDSGSENEKDLRIG